MLVLPGNGLGSTAGVGVAGVLRARVALPRSRAERVFLF